ncbi:hypothetical protein [Bacillus piscicola]|uniref:hypothetical protein n=1 Tax=Bacillus piscicola TaxID=1632684 RepID=UPI001F09DE72|nr:hypothetical protein [Bacillus piscicola]
MTKIGFELVADRSLPVQAGSTFSLSVFWNMEKVYSTVGKDNYHRSGLILPGKRITATGRIHHISESTKSMLASLQAAACHPVQCPSAPLEDLRIELIQPAGELLEPLYRAVRIHLCKKKETCDKQIPLYLDPRSIEETEPNVYLIDLSHFIPKHLAEMTHRQTSL